MTFITGSGGVALFIYGMILMGDGLQAAAGSRMRRILENLTGNRVRAVLVGIFVTAIMQASGATTVLAITFVNAGLMTLEQALAVIMGASIGTTVTAQIVSFNLGGFALPAVGVGILIRMYNRKRDDHGLADFLVGFGLLFLGLRILGEALEPLKTYPPFLSLVMKGENKPSLGFLVGTVLTVLLQSSSATTGMLVTLATKNLISLKAALPAVFGANVGTTSIALFTSIGTSVGARRTAVGYFLFKLSGALILLPLVDPYARLIAGTSAHVPRQVANGHTLFSIISTLVFLPFLSQYASFVKKIVKGEEKLLKRGPQFINPKDADKPYVALVQASRELVRMGELARQNLSSACEFAVTGQKQHVRQFDDVEDLINQLQEDIISFLTAVSRGGLSADHAHTATAMVGLVSDIERAADHAVAIRNLASYKDKNNLPFSKEALEELKSMIQGASDMLSGAVDALSAGDTVAAERIVEMDDLMDLKEKELRARHIERLNKGICYPASGVVYLEIVTRLERVADHAVNIAEGVIASYKARPWAFPSV